MVIISCPIADCGFATEDVDPAIVAALLAIHATQHQSQSAVASTGPRLDRPHIDIGVEPETWNTFCRRWETFYRGSGISGAAAPSQLFHCATDALSEVILKSDPQITTRPIDEVMSTMKSFAIIPVATGVIRAELMQMYQGGDESFRTFSARVRGKAETCAFVTEFHCECGSNIRVDYTTEMIRDVLLAGISDQDIRREALGAQSIQKASLNEVVAFVECREMARNALPASSLSAVSTFKRHKSKSIIEPISEKSTDRSQKATCPSCARRFCVFSKMASGDWNVKPHKRCFDCYRQTMRRRQHDTRDGPTADTNYHAAESESESFAQVSNNATEKQSGRQRQQSAVPLNREIFSSGEWRSAQFSAHPCVKLGIAVSSKRGFSVSKPVFIKAVTDTGAQSNLWSLQEYLRAGFNRHALKPVALNVRAANKSTIKINGAFCANLYGQAPDGSRINCRTMVYVSEMATGFFLSYDTMLDLGIIANDFPTVGSAQNSLNIKTPNEEPSVAIQQRASISPLLEVNSNVDASCDSNDAGTCKCPQRSAVPVRPTSLPFKCSPENNEKMKKWLLKRYEASTFNTCPHRPLLCMAGPPVEIHVEDGAPPRICHTAAPVPLHWQQQVREDLFRDEALGVIEKVPYGEPVTWCHRMVVTRKHDGTPRRTVDLSPLNKFCKRETFAAESPFQMARRVPRDTWKSVTDAWNGYHSVPLKESDRHLTTFITPFGRWRYTRAPQGFLSSGDGYNRRYDAILSNFQRKERCVDDTIFYDDSLEEHWWRTIDLLSTVGNAGIVLNAKKFQFAKRVVDFAGFRISDQSIEPLPKYLDAIRDFPTPASTTDIRSWFGLVNQVSNYAQLRDLMAPFKPFLSPKHPFSWTPELNTVFNASKSSIVEAIRKGVEIFDISRPTCLRLDWSKHGIGYFLLQKHCLCTSVIPDCGEDGWKITLASSRFLKTAEARYAPIEGEALAIAWGLEQTRYFTQGCRNLLVVTDHKPLVKIFGDRTLDEISNTRLFRLKQHTLPWHFQIIHLPGKTNFAADATSRHPSPSGEISSISIADQNEAILVAGIRRETEDISTIPWARIVKETQNDSTMKDLLRIVERGFSKNDRSLPHIAPYWQYREALYALEGVIMYEDRVIIPPALRKIVLENLHAAHQGVSSMEVRARTIVFWPGMTSDIHRVRLACTECNKNAPSHGPIPSVPSTPPKSPFESVFADFFDFGGRHYLVVGDRLSGWVEIYSSTSGTPRGGATGLIGNLRAFFATFGVPEELSSDGGPEFTAGITSEFFLRWGVRHRISSAYNPQSNGRAEVAVKSAKRLLRLNTGPTGSLNSDRLLRALLQLRNTPDPDCNLSPAQIIFGKPLRDTLQFANRLVKFSNPHIRPMWREAWSSKESALRARLVRSAEKLNEHARHLRPLRVGERCFIQNQAGNFAKKWDRSGTIVEVLDFDKYCVKVDGSGRVTTRNRRFLRAFDPVSTQLPDARPMYDLQNGQQPPQERSIPAKPTRIALPPHPASTPEFQVIRPAESSSATQEVPNEAALQKTDCILPETVAYKSERPKRITRKPRIYDAESGQWRDPDILSS